MLVNPESMKAWIRWTHWLSIFFYSYSSMMVSGCGDGEAVALGSAQRWIDGACPVMCGAVWHIPRPQSRM